MAMEIVSIYVGTEWSSSLSVLLSLANLITCCINNNAKGRTIMCLSNLHSQSLGFSSSAPFASESSTIGNSSTSADGPQHNKVCLDLKRKSVKFYPAAAIRLVPQPSRDDIAATWLNNEEVYKMKSRAKTLSKLHYHVRKRMESQGRALRTGHTGDATRYAIAGESLRGMEYITDIANGRKRRRVDIRRDAMGAIVIEQRAQFVRHILLSRDTRRTVDQIKSGTLEMDHCKLAGVYGSKAREAMVYAKRVGEDDAKVAAAILAEDLQQESSTP